RMTRKRTTWLGDDLEYALEARSSESSPSRSTRSNWPARLTLGVVRARKTRGNAARARRRAGRDLLDYRTRRESIGRTRRDQGDRMKSLISVLALALVPALAGAAEKPDWAFPVTEKVQPPPRFDANRVRPAPPGSTLSITRAKADDMYDIPNWFPN